MSRLGVEAQIVPKENMDHWSPPANFNSLPSSLKQEWRAEYAKHTKRFPRQSSKFYARYAWNHLLKFRRWMQGPDKRWFQAEADRTPRVCNGPVCIPGNPKPTFGDAMNFIFSAENRSESSVILDGRRASALRGSNDTLRSTKMKGGKENLTDESEGEGEDARIRAVKSLFEDESMDNATKLKLARKLLSEDEGEADTSAEGEGEGEGKGPSVSYIKPKQTPKPMQGAQTSPAEINFNASEIAAGRIPRFNSEARARFENAMRTDFWPKFKQRLYGEAQ